MLDARRYREPDIAVMLGVNKEKRMRKYWLGADFVLEVISESNQEHDWDTKRHDYAAAGIAEYWIVDPQHKTVTKLALQNGVYVDESNSKGSITSTILPGFSVDVAQMFREAEAAA